MNLELFLCISYQLSGILGSLPLEIDPTRLFDSARVRVVHSRYSHCAVLLGIRVQEHVEKSHPLGPETVGFWKHQTLESPG